MQIKFTQNNTVWSASDIQSKVIANAVQGTANNDNLVATVQNHYVVGLGGNDTLTVAMDQVAYWVALTYWKPTRVMTYWLAVMVTIMCYMVVKVTIP